MEEKNSSKESREKEELEEAQSVEIEEEGFETLQKELTDLREALSHQEQNSLTYLEQIKHLQADFENYRKRMEKEKFHLTEHSFSLLVEKLLPVIDNFERAFEAAKNFEGDSPFLKGMQMVYRQMMDLLAQEGLTLMETVGKPFNPSLHEAYAYQESRDGEDHQVMEEARKGYLWKGRVLRPAMVKVSKKPSAS